MQIDITVPKGGTTYTYLVDILTADWEVDGDEYVTLGNSLEVDVRRQRMIFTLKQIFEKVPGGSSVLDPDDLHNEMLQEASLNDNFCQLAFSLNGNSFSADVMPAPEGFNAAKTKKGYSQLVHEMTLLGKWYDPSTQSGSTQIDSLRKMKAAL